MPFLLVPSTASTTNLPLPRTVMICPGVALRTGVRHNLMIDLHESCADLIHCLAAREIEHLCYDGVQPCLCDEHGEHFERALWRLPVFQGDLFRLHRHATNGNVAHQKKIIDLRICEHIEAILAHNDITDAAPAQSRAP